MGQEVFRVAKDINVTGAAPASASDSFAAIRRGYLHRIVIVKKTAGGSPFTTWQLEIFDKDPATATGLNNLTTLPGLSADKNEIPANEIAFENQDSPISSKLYAKVTGTAGGGAASTDVFTVHLYFSEQAA